MNFKLFITAFFIFGISFSSVAQCGSHKKHVKSSYVHKNDIIDIASGDDNFSTLVLAVKTANLVNTLQGDGPFTVFAPTNSAFAKIDSKTIETLLSPEGRDQLTKILTYHVIAGEFKAKDVVTAINAAGGSFTIETVSGDKLVATLNNGSVILTDENKRTAAVTTTDIDASNGVIHVIDTVVLPQ
ncbi:MAG: fasciclin domain-containing protein [Bacteroidota bacterium]